MWNSLPADVISAPTVALFKKNLDDLWRTTRYGYTLKGLRQSCTAKQFLSINNNNSNNNNSKAQFSGFLKLSAEGPVSQFVCQRASNLSDCQL